MWRPTDEQTIVSVATAGDLQETHSFDAKAALPPEGDKRKSHDLAVDVAAMTVDGGILLYGFGEDEHGRPTVPSPIPLANQRERVDQIVQTRISEAPYIEVDEICCADDAARGYLVVVVPPSPRAPHQVDGRYRGRGATGNRVLDEGEVARLYRRRDEWDIDIAELLEKEVRNSGYSPTRQLVYLHAVARPIAPHEQMLETATGNERTDMMLSSLANLAAAQTVFPQGVMSPDLGWSVAGWQRFDADSWAAGLEGSRPGDVAPAEGVLRMIVELDGTAHLFGGRAGLSMRDGSRVLFEPYVAGNITRFLAILGGLYDRAGYFAPVGVGVAVTGLKDTVSSAGRWDRMRTPYPSEEFRRVRRLPAGALASEPRKAATALVGDLVEASAGPHFDVFALAP